MIRVIRGMRNLMLIKHTLISEYLMTCITCVWMFTRMHVLVQFEGISTFEPSTTHITAVSILICLYDLVFIQSTLRRKDTYLINVNKND